MPTTMEQREQTAPAPLTRCVYRVPITSGPPCGSCHALNKLGRTAPITPATWLLVRPYNVVPDGEQAGRPRCDHHARAYPAWPARKSSAMETGSRMRDCDVVKASQLLGALQEALAAAGAACVDRPYHDVPMAHLTRVSNRTHELSMYISGFRIF